MLFFNERYDQIIKILKERNGATVLYLANHLHVSQPTIRRDLTLLERDGIIKRTFGGAVISDTKTSEISLLVRESEQNKEKDILAQMALKYISDESVLFLDASSTVSRIIKYLPKFSNLTVITNSPKNSLKLAELHIKSFCTGGLMLENSIAYVGRLAESFITNFNADVFFLSSRGITEDGEITDSSLDETLIRKIMMKQSKKKIMLCTNNKIGQKYPYNLCNVDDVDEIIYGLNK